MIHSYTVDTATGQLGVRLLSCSRTHIGRGLNPLNERRSRSFWFQTENKETTEFPYFRLFDWTIEQTNKMYTEPQPHDTRQHSCWLYMMLVFIHTVSTVSIGQTQPLLHGTHLWHHKYNLVMRKGMAALPPLDVLSEPCWRVASYIMDEILSFTLSRFQMMCCVSSAGLWALPLFGSQLCCVVPLCVGQCPLTAHVTSHPHITHS